MVLYSQTHHFSIFAVQLTQPTVCRYTFNTPANEVNSTYVNLKERQGFMVAPFTLPTATAAASYSIERDGYVIEPQYNFHT